MKQVHLQRSNNNYPLLFDYQSTTPCSQEVLEAMAPYWNELWANASSRQSRFGLMASAAVTLAREQIASLLNVVPERLIFTSGATEANNLALLGHARAMAADKGSPGHIITLATEHHAVLDPLRQLIREGFRLTELYPGPDGLLSKDQLVEAFEEDTFLASFMFANNEIGVIQPLAELVEACKEKEVLVHSDAAQAFGHIPIEVDKLGLDFISISSHKLYGPKGIGSLVMRSELPILPLHWGGGQEQNLRPGTIPVPLIIGFAKAAELAFRDLNIHQEKLGLLRDQLLIDLRQKIPDIIVNGSMENRLPHNLNITILGVSGSRLFRELRPFISCSSGSACSAGKPSHVLLALGRTVKEADSSIRLSLGRDTSIEDIKKATSVIDNVVSRLRGD